MLNGVVVVVVVSLDPVCRQVAREKNEDEIFKGGPNIPI